MVQSLRTAAKTVSKGGMYAVGGTLIGWPLVDFGLSVYNGVPLEFAVNKAVRTASGYDIPTGTIQSDKVKAAVIRTALGVGAVYVAKKL